MKLFLSLTERESWDATEGKEQQQKKTVQLGRVKQRLYLYGFNILHDLMPD